MNLMIHWNKWIVLTFDGVNFQLGRRSKDPATQEMNDYTDLMTWLSAEAEEVLQIVDQPVTDRQQEYMVQYKLLTILYTLFWDERVDMCASVSYVYLQQEILNTKLFCIILPQYVIVVDVKMVLWIQVIVTLNNFQM